MEPQNSQPTPSEPQKSKKGYGGRSRAQWIVIYIVGAIIVYGLIYLIFFHKSGGTGGGYGY